MNKNKKYKDPLPIRFIRWFFPKLERFSPWLAERWFVKIFFTPVRYTPPIPEQVVAKESNQYAIQYNGEKIQVYEWGEGKPILMVHGWMGRATQFRKMIPVLNKAGYKVVSFDANGHGKSTGKTSNLIDIIDIIKIIASNYRQFEMIVGHSLGGVASLHAAIAGFTNKLVMISSPTQAEEIILEYRRRIGASEKMAEYFKRKVEEKFKSSFESWAVENNIQKLKTADLLFIHDEDDREVPISSVEVIKVGAPQAKLVVTKGNGHTRILKDEKVINEVSSFLKSPDLVNA